MRRPLAVPILAGAALLSPRELPAAERAWVLARSPGFVVVSDAGEKRARQVAHQFEQVRGLFAQVFQAKVDPGRMVVIFAVRNEPALKELLPERAAAKRRFMPAGVFLPGTEKHFIVLRLDTGAASPHYVLYHEYVHLLSRLQFRRLPLWLNEGLAEFYATADIDDTAARWGQVSVRHLVLLRKRGLLPLAEVTSAGWDSPLYNEARRAGPFYAQSALFTHFLLLGSPKRRGQIQQFTKLLDQDVPEAEALRLAFGDLQVLDKELRAYVRQFNFVSRKVPARLDAQPIRSGVLSPAEAAVLRADYMIRRGHLETGRQLAEEALRLAPDLGLAHEALGILAQEQGRRAAALFHLSEAARLLPANYIARFRLGCLEIAPGEADLARREQALRSAIEAYPEFAPAHARLAELIGGTRAEESIALATRAAALDPGNASYQMALWQAYRRGGREADAERAERALLAAARTDPQALMRLVLELQDEWPADAEALLKEARGVNPRNATANTLLGDLLSDQGRWDEAEALLREALRLEPESPLALNDLAYVLARADRSLPEALTLVERALERAPSPLLLDTKGLVLLRLKRLDEAERVLRKALVEHKQGETLEHLGDVLLEGGRRAEALAAYEQALSAGGLTRRRRSVLREKVGRLRPHVTPAG